MMRVYQMMTYYAFILYKKAIMGGGADGENNYIYKGHFFLSCFFVQK